MITRNNYELYIIDFYDGKLNQIQVEELYAFLNRHPDLNEEFENFSNATLEVQSFVFENKNSLKKPVSFGSEILIAYFENDLNPAEKKRVGQQLEDDLKMAQELEIIKKTRLLPDYSILFEDKSSLKRSAKVISFTKVFYRNLSIAASIILVLVAYFIFRPERSNEKMMASEEIKELVPVQAPADNGSLTPSPVTDNKTKRNHSKKEIQPKREKRIEPSSDFAQRNIGSKKVTPEQQKIQQEILPENNLAIPSKNENVIAQEVKLSQDDNLIQSNSLEQKHTLVVDLTEIFTQKELAELGLADNSITKNIVQSAKVLDVAAAKLKRFSDSKEVGVVKKKNYVDDATTYAVNVGERFSVSHTRSR